MTPPLSAQLGGTLGESGKTAGKEIGLDPLVKLAKANGESESAAKTCYSNITGAEAYEDATSDNCAYVAAEKFFAAAEQLGEDLPKTWAALKAAAKKANP